ncbi:MAG: aminotransferase class I/II-fold pyridoxal phosphate-dependent enzyme [Cyclobacteriaceae bacterium]|nr:aminotransferase class I/II-fold pyridoxal phosphate-dependent enzyme [Cyclobacteriaceae bacterium]MCH8516900.1 aminotransferase class I/II-fold pyridoxal phosphate-dependent enzyme [Cyclobacteriaceae bacterium]
MPQLTSKLPDVGTTIFATMSKMAAEHRAVNLSQGFPDFAVSEQLRTRVADYMNAGYNQYAPLGGHPSLTQAIANKIEQLYQVSYHPSDEVTVTAGATQAIFSIIQAFVFAGDEVVILDPAYDCYAPAVSLAGGRPIHVPLDEDAGFAPDKQAIRQAITPKTRMIIINSPHNPSGYVFSDEEMRFICELAIKHDLWILSDEVYEHIVLDGKQHHSILKYEEVRDRAFATFSFGKTFHATGWKIGYMVADAQLMQEVRKVHQYNAYCVNTPMQMGIADHLNEPENYRGIASLYQEKKDLWEALLLPSRFKVLPTYGSYFMLADYGEVFPDLEDVEAAKLLTQKYGVATIPISVFYRHPKREQRLLRFCFAKESETLKKAAEILCKI